MENSMEVPQKTKKKKKKLKIELPETQKSHSWTYIWTKL